MLLQSMKNRLARLGWLPGVSCLITLDPKRAGDGKKLFEALDKNRLLSLDGILGQQLKVRIPQLHLLDSCADILAEYIADIRLYSQLRLHELLTGRRPFKGENLTALIYSIVNDDPPPPSSINNNVPLLFDHVAIKALRKNPLERYQKASELRQAIADFVESFGTPKKVTF